MSDREFNTLKKMPLAKLILLPVFIQYHLMVQYPHLDLNMRNIVR